MKFNLWWHFREQRSLCASYMKSKYYKFTFNLDILPLFFSDAFARLHVLLGLICIGYLVVRLIVFGTITS